MLDRYEVQLMEMIALGFVQRRIERIMLLSDTTIESMRQKIYRKLGAKNAPHAVFICVKRNLINP